MKKIKSLVEDLTVDGDLTIEKSQPTSLMPFQGFDHNNNLIFDWVPKVVRNFMFSDRYLPNQDRLTLRSTCWRFFHELGHEAAVKKKLLSFNVIPEGLLDDPILKQFRPNYTALYNFLSRNRTFLIDRGVYLHPKTVWPLLGLMGLEKKQLKKLLGGDVKKTDPNGKSVLHYIVAGGHTDLTRKWLKYYPDIANVYPDLIYWAAYNGHEDLVFMLINEFGFKTDHYIAKSRHSLLHAALEGKNQKLFIRLIEAGANVDVGDNLRIMSAELGQYEALSYLEEHNLCPVDPSIDSAAHTSGGYAARYAILNKNLDRVSSYIENEDSGCTRVVCSFAIQAGNIELVEKCFDRGVVKFMDRSMFAYNGMHNMTLWSTCRRYEGASSDVNTSS